MPGDKVFIDSNAFLYTFDEQAKEKALLAQRWLESLSDRDCGVTNLQVLNEITSIITRRSKTFGASDPFFRVDAFAIFGSSPLTASATLAARNIYKSYRYSWWDCVLLASALELGCTHFLSEDLQDGQVIEGDGRGLTIVDPFAHTPEQILVSP